MSSPSFIEFGQPRFPRSDTLSQSGPLNNSIHPYINSFYITEILNKKKEKHTMSLDAEVTKGFLLSLQLLCFEWRFKRKKTIKRIRYVHKTGDKKRSI